MFDKLPEDFLIQLVKCIQKRPFINDQRQNNRDIYHLIVSCKRLNTIFHERHSIFGNQTRHELVLSSFIGCQRCFKKRIRKVNPIFKFRLCEDCIRQVTVNEYYTQGICKEDIPYECKFMYKLRQNVIYYLKKDINRLCQEQLNMTFTKFMDEKQYLKGKDQRYTTIF